VLFELASCSLLVRFHGGRAGVHGRGGEDGVVAADEVGEAAAERVVGEEVMLASSWARVAAKSLFRCRSWSLLATFAVLPPADVL
jgi:hypothetical protein